MQKSKIVVMVVLVLSLCLQFINIAGAGYSKKVFSTLDDIHPPTKGEPSHIQSNKGNTDYIIVSSVFSIVIYIYLTITKTINKSFSKTVDWLAHMLLVCFQFTIFITFANFITNNHVRFETAQNNILDLQAAIAQLPTGAIVPDITPYSNIFILKGLCTAALILTFLLCFVGSLFVFYKESTEVGSKDAKKAIAQKSEVTDVSHIN